MNYGIDFQYLAKGDLRPTDDGEIVGISATDKTGSVILPNVGDYVQIDNSMDGGQRSHFSGKVRSRLFSYTRISDDEVFCGINIVVEETDDDWGKLIKE
ncbi:MAG: hypothetical protein QUV08_02920 [Parasphingorhabdus sp.]|nr:hypothetical protein [Parasphingorhabdus sp.]